MFYKTKIVLKYLVLYPNEATLYLPFETLEGSLFLQESQKFPTQILYTKDIWNSL